MSTPADLARTAFAAAEADLARCRGLLAPPLTDAKKTLALKRFRAVRLHVDQAIHLLAHADTDLPFTRPPIPTPQGEGDRAAVEGAGAGALTPQPRLRPSLHIVGAR
jgi:hypothetical protein